jgi:predicted permease
MRLRRAAHRLLALFRARTLDRELADEISAHLEMAEAEGIAAGLNPEEARRRARLRFGSIEGITEAHRDRRALSWLDHLVRDAKFGCALLLRDAGFTAVVVAVLALGIGVTAAMFSVVDGALFRPLPFRDSSRIVRVWEAPRPGANNATSAPDFLDWRRLASAFDALAAEHSISVTMRGSGEPVRVSARAVTADYFRVFALVAERGRTFQSGDDLPSADPVVVLSHAAWETMFGADPEILARRVVLDGVSHRVVGVLPRSPFDRDRARFWKALAFKPNDLVRHSHWLTVFGRLRSGSTLEQARQQMRAIDTALTDVTPAYKRDWTIVVEPLDRLLVSDGVRRAIIVAFGAATLLLVIACANLANLLLAKGVSRRKELAIRAALGAGRARLVTQLLTESLLLCALGGISGIGVAVLLVHATASVLAESLPFTANVAIDWRALGFVSAIVVVVGVAVGTLPSLQTRFGNLVTTLTQSMRGSSGGTGRVRRAIVVGEVALSLMLVCGAGLLFKTLFNLQQLPTGARMDNIAAIAADLPVDVYPTAGSAARFYHGAAERVSALPGVTRVAFATHLPLQWVGNGEGITLPGIEPMVNVRYKRVDSGYFGVFDMPVIAGRGIMPSDRAETKRVIVINQALAARLLEAGSITNPIGRNVGLTSPGYDGVNGTIADVEIVGVVRSERVGDPWRPDPPVAYVPLSQAPSPSVELIVRADRDVTRVVPSVREALRRVAPALPLGDVETMLNVQAQTYSVASRPAWTVGIFAAIAALLAALGLHGVLAHLVVQRRREIGIRMALGARSKDVVWQVVRDSLSMITVGLAIGLVATAAITRLMTNLLYEVSPLDPLALTSATVTMIAIGLLASMLPARRAARVLPIDVLRDDG